MKCTARKRMVREDHGPMHVGKVPKRERRRRKTQYPPIPPWNEGANRN